MPYELWHVSLRQRPLPYITIKVLKNELLIIDPFVLSRWTFTDNFGQTG